MTRRIAVIGAGISGLATAFRLAQLGHRPTVFEQEPVAGGLAASFEHDGVALGRYYHFICGPDAAYLELLGDLGLSSRVRWAATTMGVYRDGVHHRFGTPLSLLAFSPMRPLDRLRFALSTQRSRARTTWDDLDGISARDWLIAEQGRSAYDSLWRSLLEQKFGDAAEEVSAAWMWARINRVAHSRRGLLGAEQLGYLEGGARLLVDTLVERIEKSGGEVRLGTPVDRVVSQGRVVIGVDAGGAAEPFDAVVSTVATPVFLRLAPELPGDYAQRLASVRYHGITCWVVLATRPLSPHFWLNTDDAHVPFPGVTTFSNLDPMRELDGLNVHYVPMYGVPEGPRSTQSEKEGRADILSAFERMKPGISRAVVATYRFTDRFAQPLYSQGFGAQVDAAGDRSTPLEHLYRTDMGLTYPHDRSFVNAVAEANHVAATVARRSPLS